MVGGLSLTSCAAGAFSLVIAMAGEATGQRQGALLLLIKMPFPLRVASVFIFCIITPVARQAYGTKVLEELRCLLVAAITVKGIRTDKSTDMPKVLVAQRYSTRLGGQASQNVTCVMHLASNCYLVGLP